MAHEQILVLLCSLTMVWGQFVFQHGLHPHPPHPPPPPPPAHPVGSPQFPRFSKCMNSETASEDTQSRQWEWWHREYGCASLFTSISVLSQTTAQPTTQNPHSTMTTQQPSTGSSKEPITDPGAKKTGSESNHNVAHHPEHGQANGQQRYRSHRAGGLFAGVGLTSDFYSGGFGRYSRISAAAQQDPFAWRHAAPNDVRIYIEQPQHDALEDMTNERRRKDAQTCAEFRILAAKVVTTGPLDRVCCNIICYCDELQNITSSHDRCGAPELPGPSKVTQHPNVHPTPTPAVHPPAASVIDATFGRHMPEPAVQQLTERTESNGTLAENGTMVNNGTSHMVGASTLEPTSTSTHSPKSSTPTSTGDPSSTTTTTTTSTSSTVQPNEPVSSLRKAHEMLTGGMAATVMASEKARRPVWTPIMANGDNVYHSSAHRKSYQFGAPEEWGNFIHGDSSAQNVQGKQQA